MPFESLIFALVIGLTVYLFMRRMKILKQQKRRKAEEEALGGPPPEEESMPRLGAPGTITRDQIKQLKANDFEPSRLWSREEAQLILDTVTYLRSAVFMVTGETDPPIDVQNNLLKFILTDDMLREYVYEWGLNRDHEEASAEYPELDRDDAFAKVEAAVLDQWSSA